MDNFEHITLGNSKCIFYVNTSTKLNEVRAYNIDSDNILFVLDKHSITIMSEHYEDLVSFIKTCKIDTDNLYHTLVLAMNTQYVDDGLYLMTDNIKCTEIDIDGEQGCVLKIICNEEYVFDIENIDFLEVEDVSEYFISDEIETGNTEYREIAYSM